MITFGLNSDQTQFMSLKVIWRELFLLCQPLRLVCEGINKSVSHTEGNLVWSVRLNIDVSSAASLLSCSPLVTEITETGKQHCDKLKTCNCQGNTFLPLFASLRVAK